VANSVAVIRVGVVGFIDWLDAVVVLRSFRSLELHNERSNFRCADVLATVRDGFSPKDIPRFAIVYANGAIGVGIPNPIIRERVEDILWVCMLLFALAGFQPEF